MYRCRGKNDKPNGKIASNFSKFQFEIYLVGGSGCVKSADISFRKDTTCWNIEAGCEDSSKYVGTGELLKPDKWSDWLINNNLLMYLKFKRKT